VEQITIFTHWLKQVVCVNHHSLLAETEAIILEETYELHTCDLEVATPFHPPPALVCVPLRVIILV
jgi:hypothetical protein